MIKFKAKIWKSGKSWIVTIPKSYIENKLIPTYKEINFEVEEWQE